MDELRIDEEMVIYQSSQALITASSIWETGLTVEIPLDTDTVNLA